MIRLRLFASASAAVGLDEIRLDAAAAPTVRAALAAIVPSSSAAPTASDAPAAADARRVLARCSFLVNGIATTDRDTRLGPDDEVDVMPPFAGG